MTTTTPLLLVTADPSHPLAHLALRYARAYLSARPADDGSHTLNVFFHGDGAHAANRLRWQSADQLDVTKAWQNLAEQDQLSLPIFVSTALGRVIRYTDNSASHHLSGDNLDAGFTLVGLSELAMMMQADGRLIQF